MKLVFCLSLFLVSAEALAFGTKPVVPTPTPTPNPNPTQPSNCGSQMTRAEWQKWADNIEASGGRVPSESAYANTAEGYRQYLVAAGARTVRATEMSVPAVASAAKSCGITHVLPSQCLWIRGAALALWADRFQILTGATTKIRNWYRPACYNKAVGGANGSDHLDARAMDIYFANATARRKAQASLCSTWKAESLQIGMGGSMLHVGFNSPRGKRLWYYASYTDGDRNTNCFVTNRGLSVNSLGLSADDEDGEDHDHE